MKTVRKVYSKLISYLLILLGFGSTLGLMGCPNPDPPGNRYYLDVSENHLMFPAEGGSQEVVVITEGKWSVMSHNYFVNASPQSGEGPALLTIFTDINRSKEPQKGSVQIIGETVQESIYVEQEGGLWIASIYPDLLVFSYEKGITKKLYINTSGKWKIWGIPTFVTVRPTTGYGNSTVTVTTKYENATSEDLSDYLFIDGEEFELTAIPIHQTHK